MPNKRSLVPVWSPTDTRDVFERAATFKAVEAASNLAPVVDIVTGKVTP